MDENVQRELQSLKGMVLAWKQSYLQEVPPGGDVEYLVHDLVEEIDTHVYPYTRRLCECNYLSHDEAKDFLDFCYAQALELLAPPG